MTRLCLFLCLWLSLWSERVLGSVLAIDYGADFIKASLMKPGQPFDVLLNRDSKRKIQSTVGWKHHDRLFGQDAASIVSTSFLSFVYSRVRDNVHTVYPISRSHGPMLKSCV